MQIRLGARFAVTLAVAVISLVVPNVGSTASASLPVPSNALQIQNMSATEVLALQATKGDYGSRLLVNGVLRQTEGISTVTVQPLSGPTNTVIHCSKAYLFTDGDGTYSIQHKCAGGTAPWGYKINTSLCAGATAIDEDGMVWSRNDVIQTKQAQHPYGCGYQYHGTYNPGRDGDKIKYADVMKWKVGRANYTLQIYGSFYLSSVPSGNCSTPSAIGQIQGVVTPNC